MIAQVEKGARKNRNMGLENPYEKQFYPFHGQEITSKEKGQSGIHVG